MQVVKSSCSLVLVAVLSLTGCYRRINLPPPAPPPRAMPAVDLGGAPGPGLSRIVLDTVDGPATVERVRGGRVGGVAGAVGFGGALEVTTRVCVTPCVIDTTPGTQELRFTMVGDSSRTSVGFVNVDDRPSVYRHKLGHHRNRGWRGFLGWPTLALGAMILAAGATTLSDDDHTPTITMGLTGAAFGALGGWLVYTSTIENQPGSGVQWHP
jgi:hypothetical protein